MGSDLHLNTRQGQRRLNLSMHQGRYLIDVRWMNHLGEWLPHSELELNHAQWLAFKQWLGEADDG